MFSFGKILAETHSKFSLAHRLYFTLLIELSFSSTIYHSCQCLSQVLIYPPLTLFKKPIAKLYNDCNSIRSGIHFKGIVIFRQKGSLKPVTVKGYFNHYLQIPGWWQHSQLLTVWGLAMCCGSARFSLSPASLTAATSSLQKSFFAQPAAA